MNSRSYTLGHFPPENAWGVFGTGTCPDLGGNIVPPYHYSQYLGTPDVFQLLMEVQETFIDLDIKPDPNLSYPNLEEVKTWTSGGKASWRTRTGK